MCGAFLLQIGVRVAHKSIDLDPRVKPGDDQREGERRCTPPGDDKGRVETLMAKNTSFRVMIKGEERVAHQNDSFIPTAKNGVLVVYPSDIQPATFSLYLYRNDATTVLS